jgi:hypothetical protein
MTDAFETVLLVRSSLCTSKRQKEQDYCLPQTINLIRENKNTRIFNKLQICIHITSAAHLHMVISNKQASANLLTCLV